MEQSLFSLALFIGHLLCGTTGTDCFLCFPGCVRDCEDSAESGMEEIREVLDRDPMGVVKVLLGCY